MRPSQRPAGITAERDRLLAPPDGRLGEASLHMTTLVWIGGISGLSPRFSPFASLDLSSFFEVFVPFGGE